MPSRSPSRNSRSKTQTSGRSSQATGLVVANSLMLGKHSRPSSKDDSGARVMPSTMVGDLPPSNEWHNSAIDEELQKVYIYGGCRRNDDDNQATNIFHVFDLATLTWRDLTHNLNFRRPYKPFSQEEAGPCKKALPALQNPACAVLHMDGRPFFFMFGGHEKDSNSTSSKLIAIDINGSAWFYVQVRGGPVNKRMGASMIALNNQIYIFGGREDFDDISPAVASYCIAEFSVDHEEWSWIVRDRPYPPHVPSLGYEGDAVSIYDGKKILLTPGRTINDARIEISKQTIILFHTENHTFHPIIETVGDFPTGILWYSSYAMLHVNPHLPQHHPSKKLRASNSHASSSSSIEKVAGPSTAPSIPSVVYCCWMPDLDNTAIPDLWVYQLPPEEKVMRLNLRQKIWDLNLDLRCFIVIKDRLLLMGYKAPPGSGDDTKAVYNVLVEIKLGS